MRPTPLGLMHFAADAGRRRQENQALWAKLPPLEGANKFHDLAPGAVVLADAGSGQPLLVAQSYGNGRVMAFAGDSTWHWWMHGFEAAHKRFWRQVVLWLAQERPGAGRQRVDQAGPAPAGPGAAAGFHGRGQIAHRRADRRRRFKAEIVLPDGARRPVAAGPAGRQMAGSFRDTQLPGDYAIEVTATQKDQLLGTARARFLVFQQDLELDNASADAPMLESLAAMTGGQSLAPEQLPELVKRLTQETQHLEVQQETKKTFWDTWPFFLRSSGCSRWNGICANAGDWCEALPSPEKRERGQG